MFASRYIISGYIDWWCIYKLFFELNAIASGEADGLKVNLLTPSAAYPTEA